MKSNNIDREVISFLKRVGVKKDDDYSTINNKIIDYVTRKGKKLDLDCVYLLDRQLNDSNFMIKLFKANNNLTYIFSNLSESLKHNQDFVLCYLDIVLNMVKDNSNKNLYKYFLKFKDLINKPDFVIKLLEKFPNINVISIIQKCFIENYGVDSKGKLKEVLECLPLNLLCEQAQKFGCSVLMCIPKNFINYRDIVSSAIEKDGFRALNYLSIDDVSKNKGLIIKAYKVSGIDELSYYLEFTLNPNKIRGYVENNKAYSIKEYDERCAEVQKELLQLPEIKEIYSNTAGSLNWKVKRVKSKLENSDKEDDDEQEK